MKITISPWALAFLFLSIPVFLLSACDNSGYGIADPYEISGTVNTGAPADVPIKGTVHVRTFSRSDFYEGEIDPATGAYSISIWKHDRPYLVWAKIDDGRTLYSYCAGARNPITDSDDPKPQTININPITDLIMSLCYHEDTAERFQVNPDAGIPSALDFDNFQDDIETLLADTFEDLCFTEGFNILHEDWNDKIDSLLTVLSVSFEMDPVTGPARGVVLKGGEEVLYEYDFDNDSRVNSDDLPKPDEVAEIILTLLGITPMACL